MSAEESLRQRFCFVEMVWTGRFRYFKFWREEGLETPIFIARCLGCEFPPNYPNSSRIAMNLHKTWLESPTNVASSSFFGLNYLCSKRMVSKGWIVSFLPNSTIQHYPRTSFENLWIHGLPPHQKQRSAGPKVLKLVDITAR